MNSLLNYESDDDCDSSEDEKTTDWRSGDVKGRDLGKVGNSSKQDDTNYEEVQMDLSEECVRPQESNESCNRDKQRYRERDQQNRYSKDERSYRSLDNEKRRREDERDRDRYRDKRERDRKSRRSSSRERRRSPRRSRSRSREHLNRKFSKRTDRNGAIKPTDTPKEGEGNANGNRFFMPGITGRFKEQIERRKLLWQKKDTVQSAPVVSSKTTKIWESTTFAQDTDGKVANKFKRLMGMKTSNDDTKNATDLLKKQEEMFSSMEQQYEVARTATHTMRGVGLGFSTFQR